MSELPHDNEFDDWPPLAALPYHPWDLPAGQSDWRSEAKAMRRLASRVVGEAINDACKSPIKDRQNKKRYTPLTEAIEAVDFLMTGRSDGWLGIAGLNGPSFRSRLLRSADKGSEKKFPSRVPQSVESRARAFRANVAAWRERTNHLTEQS